MVSLMVGLSHGINHIPSRSRRSPVYAAHQIQGMPQNVLPIEERIEVMWEKSCHKPPVTMVHTSYRFMVMTGG